MSDWSSDVCSSDLPLATGHLVLVNPIGLEDWRAEGVPWRNVDAWYAGQLKTGYDGIKVHQRKFYYGGQWKPEYDRWVRMLAGMYAGPGKEAVAWDQALARSEEHTSELQSLMRISYAVFCLKKKKQ